MRILPNKKIPEEWLFWFHRGWACDWIFDENKIYSLYIEIPDDGNKAGQEYYNRYLAGHSELIK